MFISVYGVTFLVAFATGTIVKNRTTFLTYEDFARGRKLPSVLPNGTILYLPHNELLNIVSSVGLDALATVRNGILNMGQKKRQKRNVFKFGPWPNARIPYTLDPNFDNNQRAQVARAIENYQSKTCIRFVPKQSTDNDYVQILRDDTTCGLAHVCKIGGAQFAKFGGGCINSGVMTHELGHTLCFGHEQTRPDRDKYIAWDTSKCKPHNIDNANDMAALDLFYDYVSIEHYEGECYNGCIKPKIPGVTKCGSGGDLSVLDVEKLNSFYNCGGCYSYRFRPISLIKNDNLVSGGSDISGEILYPCRGYYNGDILVGKGNPKYSSCHVSYNGLEYKLTENFEILTNPKKANINWKKRPTNGSFPANAIRGGRTAEREPLYIGRCTRQFNGKNTTIIGKIHRSASTGMYIGYGGLEYVCNDYDILVCE